MGNIKDEKTVDIAILQNEMKHVTKAMEHLERRIESFGSDIKELVTSWGSIRNDVDTHSQMIMENRAASDKNTKFRNQTETTLKNLKWLLGAITAGTFANLAIFVEKIIN